MEQTQAEQPQASQPSAAQEQGGQKNETPKENGKKFPTTIVVLLGIALLVYLVFAFSKQEQAEIIPQEPDTITGPAACISNSDCTLAVQITEDTCCLCPEAINKADLETNGWMAYEEDKDYSSMFKADCSGIACSPCPPNGEVLCIEGTCLMQYPSAN